MPNESTVVASSRDREPVVGVEMFLQPSGVTYEPFGRLPWFADFLRRVALLLVRLDIVYSVGVCVAGWDEA